MRRGFTLVEILVVVAIMGTMVTVGVMTFGAGRGAARLSGAARDVFASIRRARSTALITQQPCVITYSNERTEGGVRAVVQVHSAKLLTTEGDEGYETLSGYGGRQGGAAAEEGGEEAATEGRELVHIRGSKAKAFNSGRKSDGADEGEAEVSSGGGETLEEILFSGIPADVVDGVRLKVLLADDVLAETFSDSEEKKRSTISAWGTNVGYIKERFQDAKEKAAKEKAAADGAEEEEASSENEFGEQASVVWETNGRVEPHRVYVYLDGKSPESGLCIKIDRFGAAKVLGQGEDDE